MIKKNIVFFISVTCSLIFHMLIAWQPLERLEGLHLLWSNGPLMDDSYIFFNVCKELAEWFAGCNPSFQFSSGFQPLIVLLYSPFFQMFWNQKELPIHLALSLNALIGFSANILLYSLLRKIISRSIATFLVSVWIWSPYVMNQTINGMETALSFLLLLIIFNYYWQINQPSSARGRPWFFMGILLGVGFWSRVDLGMVGVAIVLDQAWLTIKGDRSSRFLRLRNILLCSAAALIVAFPWMVFTFLSTGNLLPISGRAVHLGTGVLFDYYRPDNPGFAYMMFTHFKKEFLIYQPLAALTKHVSWQLFVACLCFVGLIFALIDRQLRALFRPIWFFQIIILVSYVVFIGAFWHLNRYFYPVYSLMLFMHAAALCWVESRVRLKAWVSGIILFMLFVPFAFSYTLQYYSCWTKNYPSRYLAPSLFARERIPPKAKVGTFQSGCLSYWLDNEVINLDGVINEDAYFHLKNKTIDVYLNEQKIDYLVDEVYLFGMWDSYMDGKLSKNYRLDTMKKEKLLPKTWGEWGIYKRIP